MQYIDIGVTHKYKHGCPFTSLSYSLTTFNLT